MTTVGDAAARPPTGGLSAALKKAVDSTHNPGAVAYIGTAKKTLFHEAYGYRQLVPERKPAEKDTIYDLASITKVVATTTAALLLREDGVLDLDESAYTYVPIDSLKPITVRHLLTHTSGLPWGKALYREVNSLDQLVERYAALPRHAPPGRRRRYSDAGFTILGKVIENAAGRPLDALCAKRIFEPLWMKHTRFNPPEDWKSRCAATEDCPWRERIVQGTVHDENAAAIGGVAGSAGLFSTADDLARFCRGLLRGQILSETAIEEMTALGQTAVYPWQGLGWWLDPWESAEVGYLPTRAAFGHAGWTGTSLWIDPKSQIFTIVLANTCHPSRKNRKNAEFRRIFHNAVARTFYNADTNAHSGLDRLLRGNFAPVRDKRVALLTNTAAIDQLGRPILDVLALAPDVHLKCIYSPEHGFTRQAEAGAKVDHQAGPVPIISLYGKRKRPSREELDQVDCFVVDLQDVGARYYTYMATMLDCMRACADARTPVLILDRPNPIGGDVIEGPMPETTGSPVCCAPIPVRHGMTLGELALYFRYDLMAGSRLELSISRLDNWRPNQLFSQTSLPWIPPSPNIPTPETALIYPGACLFEGVNLNEGRGTDTPFLLVGAPWLDPEAVLRRIPAHEHPGCTLEPARYTPRAIPGKAANPAYRDQECQGIRIRIDDPHQVRSFTLGLALIAAIRHNHPQNFEWKTWFDTLTGAPSIRTRIDQGDTATDIVTALAPALQDFDKRRPRLYREEGETA